MSPIFKNYDDLFDSAIVQILAFNHIGPRSNLPRDARRNDFNGEYPIWF